MSKKQKAISPLFSLTAAFPTMFAFFGIIMIATITIKQPKKTIRYFVALVILQKFLLTSHLCNQKLSSSKKKNPYWFVPEELNHCASG